MSAATPATAPSTEFSSFDQRAALVAGAVIGGTIALLTLPFLIGDLARSLIGAEPKGFWYLARSSGITAYWALWLSMILGLLMTTRLAPRLPGGMTAFDLHRFTSLLAVGVAAFHAAILIGDRYLQIPPLALAIPFAVSAYRPFWVGLGQIALILMAALSASFWVHRQIGQRTWRLIHWASFGGYALALLHGIAVGTDMTAPLVAMGYWVSGGALLILSLGRGIELAR